MVTKLGDARYFRHKNNKKFRAQALPRPIWQLAMHIPNFRAVNVKNRGITKRRKFGKEKNFAKK
jgi:hypothetical protein